MLARSGRGNRWLPLASFKAEKVLPCPVCRLVVFGGAIAALALMTVLSAGMGYAGARFLSPVYTHYAAIGLVRHPLLAAQL